MVPIYHSQPVLFVFFQDSGLRQRGHSSTMSADPPQPRGLPSVVPETLLSQLVCCPTEWDCDGLYTKQQW